MRRRIVGLVLGAGLVAAALSSCGNDGDGDGTQTSPSVTQVGRPPTTKPGETTTSTEPDPVPVVDSVVAASVHEPVALISRPGDGGHLWLAERDGRVRRMTIADSGDTLTPAGSYAVDISDQTTTEAERGLLGIAFSPAGETLYLSYTDTEGDSRVVSYEMDGNEVVASSRTQVYAIDQPYPNHNGGHISFGPDGKLWLGLGDGGSADDPENRAQDPTTDLGKIIRIDVATGEREIAISGVRNPWRFAFDADGSLWIGDVGQNNIEEIDHLEGDEILGANLGWSGFEGAEPYQDGDGRRPDDATPPVFQYTHDGGNCSITGGFVYRGKAIPELDGAYLFADYCAGRIRAITLTPLGELDREFDLGVDVERPVSFAQDQQGEPYVLSLSGNIVRLLPAT